MRFLWAARGRDWGFAVLVTGGLQDPLSAYEDAFADLPDDAELWRVTDAGGALRFPDPEGRRDRAGRPLLHDFVLPDLASVDVRSVDDGRQLLWPVVSAYFDDVVDAPARPGRVASLDV